MIFHTMQKMDDGTFVVGAYVNYLTGPSRPSWQPLFAFGTFQEAARWVHFLNGGPNQPALMV